MYALRCAIRFASGITGSLLAFKSPPDVAEAAKRVLSLIFLDPDQNVDDRLAATTALRRAEDVRIVPAIERPVRTDDTARVEVCDESGLPVFELIRRHGAHASAVLQSGARPKKIGVPPIGSESAS